MIPTNFHPLILRHAPPRHERVCTHAHTPFHFSQTFHSSLLLCSSLWLQCLLSSGPQTPPSEHKVSWWFSFKSLLLICGPTPDPQNQSLPFKKIPRSLKYTLSLKSTVGNHTLFVKPFLRGHSRLSATDHTFLDAQTNTSFCHSTRFQYVSQTSLYGPWEQESLIQFHPWGPSKVSSVEWDNKCLLNEFSFEAKNCVGGK